MMELISQHQQQGSSPHRSQSFRHHRTSRHTQFEGGQGTITPKYSQEVRLTLNKNIVIIILNV